MSAKLLYDDEPTYYLEPIDEPRHLELIDDSTNEPKKEHKTKQKRGKAKYPVNLSNKQYENWRRRLIERDRRPHIENNRELESMVYNREYIEKYVAISTYHYHRGKSAESVRDWAEFNEWAKKHKEACAARIKAAVAEEEVRRVKQQLAEAKAKPAARRTPLPSSVVDDDVPENWDDED